MTPGPRPGEAAGALLALPFSLLMRAFDAPMRALQTRIGQRRMPYLFLLPNLLFFGTFVFLPLIINVGYSLTGGAKL
ncbi:MAG: sugar ABC transporter permease, partial [Alsobacter sp.]